MLVPETQIIISRDGAELSRATVRPGDYVIGCHAEAEIKIDAEGVAERHAQLTVNYNELFIEDLGSDSGIFIGGKRITESMRLWPSQKVQIGSVVLETRKVKSVADSDVSLAPDAATVRRVLPDEFLRARKYEIGGLIAQGGMGAILGAHEATTQRTVAMKVMLSHMSESAVLRFIEEAQITSQLEHPNIVPVHELGVDEHDQVFYTMKLVQGVTLRQVLEKLHAGDAAAAATYPLRRLLIVLMRVCDAMAFAHSRGVIHRDLKPDNVMIGDFGEVLVMDWGLAKVLRLESGKRRAERESGARSLSDFRSPVSALSGSVRSVRAGETGSFTMAGSIVGTPHYMSPEQARGESETLDEGSDIWALGAILRHVLTLARPVPGATVDEVIENVRAGRLTQIPPRAAHCPGGRVPEALIAVAAKAQALNCEDRYASVAQFRDEIDAYLGGFATKAEQAGLAKQLLLLIQRHKGIFSTAAAAWLLITALGVWFIFNLRVKERRAVDGEQNAIASEAAVRQTSYSTEMLFAAEEIEAENRGQAMELLNRSRPRPGQLDLRGWEWRYLWAQCRSDELFTLGAHDQEIYRLAFLPDGRLVCGDFGNVVKIWDPKTKTVLASERVGPISDLEISPDGSVIAAAYWAADFAFLDATNLTKKGSARFRNKVYHLAFSPRDKVFATAGPDHVALWAFTLPSPTLVWSEVFSDVTGLAFAPDGETFVFATKDQRIFNYDATTRTMRKTMAARGEPSEVAFNPDGSRLAVSHWNGAVGVYDPASGAEIATLTNHTAWVSSLAFSRTDPILATSSADQRIRLWDTRTWKETVSFKGHLSLVDCVAVSPDGGWLASGSKDRSVRIWDLKANAVSGSRNFASVQRGFAVSPKAEFLGVVNDDATMSLWNLVDRRETQRLPIETGTTVLATSPTGTAVVLGNRQSEKVWMHRIDTTNRDIQVEGALARKAIATFSSDGKMFAVSGSEQSLRVGAVDGSAPVRVMTHPIDLTTEILFSHDGRQIFAANESGKLRVCDTATGEIVWDLSAHNHVVKGVALDADGRRLATSSADGTVGLWDLATRRKLGSYGKSSLGYSSVSFSRDGKRIAAASGEGGPVKV
jgi:WD40 repeat protein/serine/threonine protein kinase